MTEVKASLHLWLRQESVFIACTVCMGSGSFVSCQTEMFVERSRAAQRDQSSSPREWFVCSDCSEGGTDEPKSWNIGNNLAEMRQGNLKINQK